MAWTELLTGPAFLLFLAGAGLFFTVSLHGMQFFHFGRIWKETFGSLGKQRGSGKVSPFQAAMTALAGAMGTGNIVGVGTAIVSGGPGAVFWMWGSSLFSMALKYAEIVLAVRYRRKDPEGGWRGGPMYYMEQGLHSRRMAVWFSAVCMAAAFGIGNLAQASAAAETMQEALAVPKWATALILTIFCGLAVFGGIRRIVRVTEWVVPAMAAAYLGASLWILAVHFRQIPAVCSQILGDAFQFDSAAGGVLGFAVSRSVRYGIARGVFSNEAGMGSAAIVHGSADTDSPARQGMWGIMEVFLDTTVMCTLTAFVILTAVPDFAGRDGASLTLEAFQSVFGRGAGAFPAVSVLLFAAASILGWNCCGEQALGYLTPSRRAKTLWRLAWLLGIWLGTEGPAEGVWLVSDLLNLSMAVPNGLAVLLLHADVLRETRFFLRQKCGENEINIGNIQKIKNRILIQEKKHDNGRKTEKNFRFGGIN